MLDLLFKNARVYAPRDLGVVSVGVRDGKIVSIGEAGEPAARTIDCAGKTLLPGAIETHAHMLLPFGGTHTMNDFFDGTMSGAIGGVTTLIDFADQVKGGSALAALEARLGQAAASAVDYSFHVTLTDINDATLNEIDALLARGITSYKFYTAYSAGGLYVPPADMERAFAALAKRGALATVHCEDEDTILAETARLIAEGKTGLAHFSESRPDESERLAIANVIEIARRTGAKLLIRHVSSADGGRLIAEAQSRGQTVIGETCPHYLMLTRGVYQQPDGARYLCNPPIRGEADREALWGALMGDTKFTIGTDDCAFYLAQKQVSDKFYEIPGGMPGIETRVPVLLTAGVSAGRLSMERFVHLVSTDVAKLYGIYPQKGTIAVGSDADLMLVEPCAPYPLTVKDLHEKSDYTPFEGMPLDHRVTITAANGRVIAENGEFCGTRGAGRFLRRGLPAELSAL